MEPSSETPEQTPNLDPTAETPDIIKPGYGAAMMRLPDWFRHHPPGEPFTPAEREQLAA